MLEVPPDRRVQPARGGRSVTGVTAPSSVTARHAWLRRALWTGLGTIWLYWASLFLLPPIFALLKIVPQEHPWLVGVLSTYYWPVTTLMPYMSPLFGYSMVATWYAPIIAPILGALLCTLSWMLVIRLSGCWAAGVKSQK